MSTSQLSARNRAVFGLVAMAAGLFPMALALGWIPARPGSMHAPAWVAFLAASTFVLAGLLIWLPDRLAKSRELLGALLVTSFAVVMDWIAFGPGERHFSSAFSLGPWAGHARSSAMGGRLLFGIGGALITLLAVLAWGRWLKSLISGASERV